MDIASTLALTLGAGWASGINLYLAVLTLGLAQRLGFVALPGSLDMLASPWVLGAATVLTAVNFIADKIPAVDSILDAIQTFVKIPAGVLLAVGAASNLDPAIMAAAGLVGGALAAGSHAAKTGSRVLVNTSPEPFSNMAVSFFEETMVVGGLALAILKPWVFFGALAVLVALTIWLLPKLIRLALTPLRKLLGLLPGGGPPLDSGPRRG